MQFKLADENDTLALGQRLARGLSHGGVIYLHGDLGAGKTTLSRGIVQSLGHQGAVKSPTYTIVEPYQLGELALYHFDLYRLADPEELEFMGIRDYFQADAVCLVEWPDKGGDHIPQPDLILTFQKDGMGRIVSIKPLTERGQNLLGELTEI